MIVRKQGFRNVGLAALATLACIGFSNSASAQQYHHGGASHNHGCTPHHTYGGHGYSSYRAPIVVYPQYGISRGYPSTYRSYSSNYGGYSGLGIQQPTWGGYGMGGFPIGGSYGGGAFPRGGSYGGGSGFSLYIGR